MTRGQNGAQRRRHLWLIADRTDNCFWRGQRGIDLAARRDCALGFLGMIEQFLRELHRPRNICDAAIKFAVDEIGAAAEEQTDRRRNDQIIAEISPRDFVTVGVIQGEQQQPKHPAVARHAAFPDAQD